MNEIEKLMENAGINRLEKSYCSKGYCNQQPNIKFGNNETCRTCEKGHFYLFPEFNDKKQLELIKWLGKLAGKLEISSNYNDTQYLLYFYLNRKTRDELLPNISTGRSENFEESLAGLINSLWQDLTKEEKEEIRGILK